MNPALPDIGIRLLMEGHSAHAYLVTATNMPIFATPKPDGASANTTLVETTANCVLEVTMEMHLEVCTFSLLNHGNEFIELHIYLFLGTPYDCQQCGCPNGGACIQLDEDIVMCVECPLGYTGYRCDSCADGYYGDPTGQLTGEKTPCQQCECNLNIDPNAVGNCNTTTGECIKCIHNTHGRHCHQCLNGKL